MLVGHLDPVTSSGYVEGWAYDANDPLRALVVAVLTRGEELSRGIANRYRWDLASAGCGTGWCAFRLRIPVAASKVCGQSLILSDVPSKMEICRTRSILMLEDNHVEPSGVEEVTLSDPTLVHSIEQLRGCDGVLAGFIDAVGLDRFIRTAFIYILGRPVDASSMVFWLNGLQGKSTSPYELLLSLHGSEEFRSAPRLLIAPSEPGFPFQRPSGDQASEVPAFRPRGGLIEVLCSERNLLSVGSQ
jgi:hypothetical protein